MRTVSAHVYTYGSRAFIYIRRNTYRINLDYWTWFDSRRWWSGRQIVAYIKRWGRVPVGR